MTPNNKNSYDELDAHVTTVEAQLVLLQEAVDRNTREIRAINDTLVRYQGFLGGVLFIIGGLGLVLGIFKTAISKALGM